MSEVPRQSLQTRLLTLLLGLVAVIWLGAAVLTWYDASHELDELLDGHLAQAAALLVAHQNTIDEDDDVADAPPLHRYAPKVAFQVFRDGALVTSSSNARAIPMNRARLGFSTLPASDGTQWRVFATMTANNSMKVTVGEQLESRQSILWAILRSVLWPLGIAFPLLGLSLWWAVRQGLVPLRQLGYMLSRRQPQALEPVVLGDMPSEMQPVVRALNSLFERIQAMLLSERRFTADAAHELRTPIAAIRAQAQVASGAGDDAGERDRALRATLAGCDRAARLVEQLLTLARLENAMCPATGTLDLGALARRVAADLAPTALQQAQSLELRVEAAPAVRGDEVLTGVLLRNLMDNALRYSPRGAQVRVLLRQEPTCVALQVDDSGPGMTQEEMTRLGERFFRVLGNERPGSGLGWSIVRRIAAVYAIDLEVQRSSLLGGLAVRALWPLEPESAALHET